MKRSNLSKWSNKKTGLRHADCKFCRNLPKASTTLSLGLCPPASPKFTWPWNWNSLSPHGNDPNITFIWNFSSILVFLNVKWNLLHLNFDVSSTLMPSKLGKKCCDIEMRPAQPHFPWNLDTDLNSELCWPNGSFLSHNKFPGKFPKYKSLSYILHHVNRVKPSAGNSAIARFRDILRLRYQMTLLNLF